MITYTPEQLRGMDPQLAMREQLRARIAAAFGGDRSGLADNAAQGVRDYNLMGLAEQRAKADREAGFDLARRGQVGSSSEIDSLRDRDRITDDALRATEADALSASNSLRSGDATAQAGLHQGVNAGLGTGEAITDALKALQFQSQQNMDYIKGRAIGDAANQFSTMAQAYQLGDARKRARDYASSLGLPGASSYGGTLYNKV